MDASHGGSSHEISWAAVSGNHGFGRHHTPPWPFRWPFRAQGGFWGAASPENALQGGPWHEGLLCWPLEVVPVHMLGGCGLVAPIWPQPYPSGVVLVAKLYMWHIVRHLMGSRPRAKLLTDVPKVQSFGGAHYRSTQPPPWVGVAGDGHYTPVH